MSKLQELRLARGLSQKALAERVGIDVGILQAYEQGRRNLDGAKIETLARFALILECSIPDILENPTIAEMVRSCKK